MKGVEVPPIVKEHGSDAYSFGIELGALLVALGREEGLTEDEVAEHLLPIAMLAARVEIELLDEEE